MPSIAKRAPVPMAMTKAESAAWAGPARAPQGCIVIAGILVGLQTYPPFDGSHVELDDDKASEAPVGFLVVEAIDNAILAIFGLECVVKIVAEGAKPWRFFVGGEAAWNNFDFVVVVLCLPIWGDALGGGSVKLLRLMRLARIVKLLKRVPQLYIIVKGLIGGMKSIGCAAASDGAFARSPESHRDAPRASQEPTPFSPGWPRSR